ncbi:SRPBCC family protein [Hypericibacter sp.]|uniref:SRPBCC family protein n=1 Tax=Hypericibacter sp. TaxID=2705401 RepID=UPI003D6C8386
MLIKILIGIALIVAIFVVVVALQPSDFRIERTTTIAAPADAVFAQVNDFHKWEAWSPYDKIDPALKRTYSGAPAGVGAIYEWVGNKQVGEGKATITDSRPNELVQIQLDFLKPFAATNIAEFSLAPQGGQTAITWSMTGHNNFMFKAVGLFMNMDKMVGGQFEQGLAQLKTLVESAPAS